MTGFFRTRWTSVRQFFLHRLRSRLVWLTNERLDFNGQAQNYYAFAAVIGREYYRERRKKYPIASRPEVLRVIGLETRGSSGVFVLVGPLVDNSREVRFFEVRESFPVQPRALFWIPESVVAALALRETEVATIQRGDFCYYLSRSGTSQLRGGAIVSPGLFRMAAGVPLEGVDRDFSGPAMFPCLESGLRQLRATDWWSFRGPEFQRTLQELWRPTAVLVAGLLLAYLSLVSAYLHGSLALRQWQIDRLGAEVAPLLRAQRQVDLLAAERDSMKKIVTARAAAWPLWEVATQVWNSGGAFSSISFKDGQVVIEGRAPSAIKVLEELDARADVSTAEFDSAVRQVADAQQFVIRLRLVRRPDDGRGS